MIRILSFCLLTLLGGWDISPKALGEKPQRPDKDFALFFAVTQYEPAHKGLRNLINPIKNAEAIGRILQNDFGFKVEIVRNPSLEQIEDKLIEYRDKFAKSRFPSDAQLFISFSGHGMQELKEGYFLPKDADPNLLRKTALPYTYWRNFSVNTKKQNPDFSLLQTEKETKPQINPILPKNCKKPCSQGEE